MCISCSCGIETVHNFPGSKYIVISARAVSWFYKSPQEWMSVCEYRIQHSTIRFQNKLKFFSKGIKMKPFIHWPYYIHYNRADDRTKIHLGQTDTNQIVLSECSNQNYTPANSWRVKNSWVVKVTPGWRHACDDTLKHTAIWLEKKRLPFELKGNI